MEASVAKVGGGVGWKNGGRDNEDLPKTPRRGSSGLRDPRP